MKRITRFVGVLLFVVFGLGISSIAEEITLTTYYPAPYGAYEELQANKFAVGSTATIPTTDGEFTVTSNAYLATDSGNVGIGDIAPDGKFEVNPDGVEDNGDEFIVASDGNVGIGTTDPQEDLHVRDTVSDATIRIEGAVDDGALLQLYEGSTARASLTWSPSDYLSLSTANPVHNLALQPVGGNVGIGTTTPGFTLTVAGTSWCTSGSWSGSDIRWKENIETLSNPLERVLRLRGVKFDWKQEEFKDNNFPEERQIGIIAQELEKEFPELVTTNEDGYKAIAYDRFTAVLLEAIKVQQKEIDELKEDIERLKQQ